MIPEGGSGCGAGGLVCDVFGSLGVLGTDTLNSSVDSVTSTVNDPLGAIDRASKMLSLATNPAAAFASGRVTPNEVIDQFTGMVEYSCSGQGNTTKNATRCVASAGLLFGLRWAGRGKGRAAPVVHGNSAASQRTAFLYRLETDEGQYLKTGITQDPHSRYTADFMIDKQMIIMERGSRREMLALERLIVEQNPGPWNREPWAGTGRD